MYRICSLHFLCFFTISWLHAAVLPERPSRTVLGVKIYKDLVYQSHPTGDVKLDLYLPRATKPTSLVIWVHGGGWRAGDKDPAPVTALLAAGIATAAIEYRFTSVAPWPAQLHDCQAAVRWLRKHAQELGIAPQRIGAWGASAGGHLVSMLGTRDDHAQVVGEGAPISSRVQAVCNWFGPTDFISLANGKAGQTVDQFERADSMIGMLLGGPLSKRPKQARDASPVAFVTADDAPHLLMHGTKDRVVAIEHAHLLQQALQRAKVPVELVQLDAGHGDGPFRTKASLQRVVRFFAETLRE